MTTKTQAREEERQDALDRLRVLFPKGSKVHTITTHVAQSGMSRAVKVLAVKDGDIWDVSYLVARATDRKVNQRHGGVVVTGCGMDMEFHVVYGLSAALYGYGDRGAYDLTKVSL